MLKLKMLLPLVVVGLTVAVALVGCPFAGSGSTGVLTIENYMLNRNINTLNVRQEGFDIWGPDQLTAPIVGASAKAVGTYQLTGIPAGVYDLRALVSTPTVNTAVIGGPAGSVYYYRWGVPFNQNTWFWRFSTITGDGGVQTIVETLNQD